MCLGLSRRKMLFPLVGSIYAGIKTPLSGDFKFDIDETRNELHEKIIANWGESPNRIEFFLPFNSIEENLSHCYVANRNGVCLAYSENGEIFDFLRDYKTMKPIVLYGKAVQNNALFNCKFNEIVRYQPVIGYDENGNEARCVALASLAVIMPQSDRLEYLSVITNSKIDTIALQEQLRIIESATRWRMSRIRYEMYYDGVPVNTMRNGSLHRRIRNQIQIRLVDDRYRINKSEYESSIKKYMDNGIDMFD